MRGDAMTDKADNNPDLVWKPKHERMCRRRNLNPQFARFCYAAIKPIDPEVTIEEIIRDSAYFAKKAGLLK